MIFLLILPTQLVYRYQPIVFFFCLFAYSIIHEQHINNNQFSHIDTICAVLKKFRSETLIPMQASECGLYAKPLLLVISTMFTVTLRASN